MVLSSGSKQNEDIFPSVGTQIHHFQVIAQGVLPRIALSDAQLFVQLLADLCEAAANYGSVIIFTSHRVIF